jgi:hypothetical protein
MIIRDDEASGIVDRIFGAIIACIFSLITFFLAPIFLLSKFWAKAYIFKFMGVSFGIRRLSLMPFFIWIVFISILAFGYGAYSGTLRTITMLSHLWGTSHDREMTQKIWVIFIVGFMISLFLMAYKW